MEIVLYLALSYTMAPKSLLRAKAKAKAKPKPQAKPKPAGIYYRPHRPRRPNHPPPTWMVMMAKLKLGQKVEATVKQVWRTCAYCDIGVGVDARLPWYEASKEFVSDMSYFFQEGDIIQAEIVELNIDFKRIRISCKNLA